LHQAGDGFGGVVLPLSLSLHPTDCDGQTSEPSDDHIEPGTLKVTVSGLFSWQPFARGGPLWLLR
jgi:hypothetical protein